MKKGAGGKKKDKMVKKMKKDNRKSDQETLLGAKFRLIDEKLYTNPSGSSLKFFKDSPEYFEIMHKGFSVQAQQWPVVPNEEVIKWLKKKHLPPEVVADMGCGDAKISASVENKVYSFDFKARNSRVTECDMAHTPLEDKSVDVVVFVLSLMGTNLQDFIKEARRIIKDNGILLVIEVTSRIENLDMFIQGIADRGFQKIVQRPLTSYFTWIEFTTGYDSDDPVAIHLKPCLYKRR